MDNLFFNLKWTELIAIWAALMSSLNFATEIYTKQLEKRKLKVRLRLSIIDNNFRLHLIVTNVGNHPIVVTDWVLFKDKIDPIVIANVNEFGKTLPVTIASGHSYTQALPEAVPVGFLETLYVLDSIGRVWTPSWANVKLIVDKIKNIDSSIAENMVIPEVIQFKKQKLV